MIVGSLKAVLAPATRTTGSKVPVNLLSTPLRVVSLSKGMFLTVSILQTACLQDKFFPIANATKQIGSSRI